MDEEDSVNDLAKDELINRTWKKLERDLQKHGFREGALKGKEDAYQNGFDMGYNEGFRIGEIIGFGKGLSAGRINKIIDSENVEENNISNDELRMTCIFCQDKKNNHCQVQSYCNNLEEIHAQQKIANDQALVNIHSIDEMNTNR